MAQPEDVAALLEGPKDRRAECAITSAMDKAVELFQGEHGCTRSQAFRIMLARGAATVPGLIGEAVRLSRTRDVTEQPRHGE